MPKQDPRLYIVQEKRRAEWERDKALGIKQTQSEKPPSAAAQLNQNPEFKVTLSRAFKTGDFLPVVEYAVDFQLEQMEEPDNNGQIVKDRQLIATIEKCHEPELLLLNTVFDVLVDRNFEALMDTIMQQEFFKKLDPEGQAMMIGRMIKGVFTPLAISAIERKTSEYMAVYAEKIAKIQASGIKSKAATGPSDTASMVSTSSVASSAAMSEALESVSRSLAGRADRPDRDGDRSARRDDRNGRDDRDRGGRNTRPLPRR